MEQVITISDWWDGPLLGLAACKESICIYERIFDDAADDWSDEYYLTPIGQDAVDLLLRDWDKWCKAVRHESLSDYYASHSGQNLYRDTIESSAQKRAYRKTAIFHGRFSKGYIPIDYSVEWISR